MKHGFLNRIFRRAGAALAALAMILPAAGAADGYAVNGYEGYASYQPASISATSYIVGKDPQAYAPGKMTDGKEETAWQFSTAKSKLGSTFVYVSFSTPVTLDQLWIKNGFWKYTNGHDQYTRNSRVKRMGIAYQYSTQKNYEDEQNFSLRDDTARKDWQRLPLSPKKQVRGLRIRIREIYAGEKFKTDVCISELLFVNSQGNGTAQRPAGTAAGGDLYARAIDKLATREGPGTEYKDLGTYSVKGQMIRILAKTYDLNGVCWVQCEIPYRDKTVTAWTGWKRFEPQSLDINEVPLW